MQYRNRQTATKTPPKPCSRSDADPNPVDVVNAAYLLEVRTTPRKARPTPKNAKTDGTEIPVDIVNRSFALEVRSSKAPTRKHRDP